MNPDWKNHLRAAGAVLDNEAVLHFGDPSAGANAARNGCVIADLSHYGVIGFAGEDAQTFLQGQLTCDVRLVTPQQAQFGSLCSAKGRMLATFLLWRRNGDIFMELPAASRECVQKHLSKYVLRAKVKVRDASDEFVRLGVAGMAAPGVLARIFGAPPPAPHGAQQGESGTLIALPGGRYEIVASPEQAAALWDELRQDCTPAGASCWDWLALRAGIPAILPATQEQFTPQMANLELLGGVSFTKGCYTGQEVVARTQYLGKVKRRLYLAHIPGDAAPQPGDALAGTEHGMIVNAAAAPSGGYDVLAVMPMEDAEAGQVRWKSAAGALLQLLPMPYAVS